MRDPIEEFRSNLQRVKNLGFLAEALRTLSGGTLDVSDIWRAQLVLLVSAVDRCVHEMAVRGMVEVAEQNRNRSDAYNRFLVPLTATHAALAGAPASEWLADAVRARHGWLAFQHPDRIVEALRPIVCGDFWQAVGAEVGMDAEAVKRQLLAVVDRRNKIAHEADVDPSYPDTYWPITAEIVASAVEFVEKVVSAIDRVVARPGAEGQS